MEFADLQPDRKIGNYVYNQKALLGSGSFGRVYLGKDEENNNPVAIKIMESQKMQGYQLKKALENEIKILSSLKGPNVVGMLSYLQTSSRHYIIQQFCNGGDFRGYLQKRGNLPEDEAKKILSDLLGGFAELYRLNLIHRDLKPENILIHDGVFKVADFGFGREVDNFEEQMLTTQVGSPLYMAPQILKGEKYTSKSDIWSLGNIYYEMLFGKTPWPCRTQYELINNMCTMPVKFPYNVKISDESKDFIKGCLTVEESKRFSWDDCIKHKINSGSVNINHDAYNLDDLDSTVREVLIDLQRVIISNKLDLKRIFNTKNNGKDLNLQQLTAIFQIIDEDTKSKDVELIFKKFDTNNSGTICYKEFHRMIIDTDYSEFKESDMMMRHKAQRLIKKLKDVIEEHKIEIEKIFKNFDKSGSQTLDLSEMTRMFYVIKKDITPREAMYAFEMIDQQETGEVTLEQLKKILEPGSPDFVPENDQIMVEKSEKIVFKVREAFIENELDIAMIFNYFKDEKSGVLEVEGLIKLFKTIMEDISIDEVKFIFKLFDKDEKGGITQGELEKGLGISNK